jgi:molybdopterin/thiamine biosynthesis adenylyltransferase
MITNGIGVSATPTLREPKATAILQRVSERYSRQILFEGIGPEGQKRLLASRVVIIGCGALGSAQAESLARAGVGFLRIIDRDFVESSNLQRQTMFTERDAEERLPKAIAAADHIKQINSQILIEPVVADVNHSNIEQLIRTCDLVIDGTDNFSTRYLINDACVKHQMNWIYGAAVGSYGVTMTIRPHQSACLRCLFDELPAAGSAPTCETAGVIMPIINIISAVQVSEALKLLTSNFEDLHGSLLQFDVWRNEWRQINPGSPRADCKTCALGVFESLAAEADERAAVLCGRDAVQILPATPTAINFQSLAARLEGAGEVKFNDYLLRFRTGDFELTVFQDARSIIRGTDEISMARSLYSKYIGN